MRCEPWCNEWTCSQSECVGCPACMPASPPAPISGMNPFSDVDFLISPRYTASVHHSVRTAGGASTPTGQTIALAAGIPTAVWLDAIDAIPEMRATLELARRQQQSTGRSVLCVYVIYNLPGRDCSAAASAGELATGELARYKNEYITPIAELAAAYPDLRKVFVVEPDSLPNIVTNMGRPKCASAAAEYKEGIAHAIRTLGPLGSVYIDAAWSGWIGTWNVPQMATLLDEVLKLAGRSAHYVRGFVTNVSNYGSVAAETAYAAALRAALLSKGHNFAYIIDTGRNGGGQTVGPQSSWCNPRRATMGPPPSASPSIAAFADAFFWIKPP